MPLRPFTLVTHEQGSAAWLAWRRGGIGASDAPTVMGENPYASAEALLRTKRGSPHDAGTNAAMRRGTELEPEARRRYEARTGRDVRPACVQSTLHEWLRASLDGLAVEHDAVVEIKCGESTYRKSWQTKSVPGHYYAQTQHILAITGLESLDFWCYWPGQPELLIPVPRNESYIQRLIQQELAFWLRVEHGRLR